MGRLLIVTSGKGGVGKSTVSATLAVALTERSKKVLLVDADEGLRCQNLLFDTTERLMFDGNDVMNGAEDLKDAVMRVSVPMADGQLSLLAAPANPDSFVSDKYGEMIYQMTKDYDFVIVDCPAGLDSKYYKYLPSFSEMLIITNPDFVAAAGAERITELLESFGLKKVNLIINRFDAKAVKKGLSIGIDDTIDRAGIKLLGIVPEDETVRKLSAKGKPVQIGRAAKAIYRIAARLEGRRIELPKIRNI